MENGYEDTSISDILIAAGISRGAMYHYFSSKEEVLDMVIDYLMSLQEEQINGIVSDSNSSALDKMERLLCPAVTPTEISQVRERMQQNTKSLFFYLSREEACRRSIPLVVRIIEQGIAEGVFQTEYPAHMAEYVYTVIQSLSSVFSSCPKEDVDESLNAFLFFLRQTLGMTEDAVQRLKASFAKAFYGIS